MYRQNNKNLRLFIFIFCIISISIISFSVYNLIHFHVVSVNPSISKINIATPFIQINTNHQLSKNIKVTGTSNLIKSYSIRDKQIYIQLNTILEVKKYNLVVTNISDKNGNKIAELNYTFNPTTNGFNTLPADQLKFYLDQQLNYNNKVYSGIYSLLPFTGPNFEYQINYDIEPSGNPLFTVKYNSAKAKQDAINFMNYYKVNSNNSTINYVLTQNI